MDDTREPAPAGERILVAEDDLVARRILEQALRGAGYQPVTAPDGHEAWHRFRANPFRIVVSDWDMPGVDGLELCRRIRSFASETYPYFIMVTAKCGPEEYQAAMDAGVDDFLSKPLDRVQLMIRLRVAMRILGFRRELNVLRDIIPVCAHCKKVRDDRNYWEKVESYLERSLETGVSHSICPECFAAFHGTAPNEKISGPDSGFPCS